MSAPRHEGSPGVLAGIDEAGLGPMLGPLALGWCALRVPRPDLDLHAALAEAVAARHARGETRLVVADSKEVFDRSARGWDRLEATALAFLACRQDTRVPASGRDLVETPGPLSPTSEELERHPWYEELPGALPARLDPAALDAHVTRLGAALAEADVQVVAGAVRLVPAGELNDSFRWTESKSRTVWGHVANALEDLWTRFGQEHVFVHLDRQGGRTRYAEILRESFPMSQVRVVRESSSEGEYVLDRPGARLTLRVTPRGETESFAVAVGSCLAKYGREVAMEAFNSWFGQHQEGLRPTAGYVTDARRWLEDAGPALRRAGVPVERLVRQR